MPNDEPSQKPTLNVFLHGTFAFVQKKGEKPEIHALIPDIPQHTIRAGNWLGETGLRGGATTYTLEGVKADPQGSFDRNRNLFVKYKELDDDPEPYATLIFPWPSVITSLRVAEIDSSLFDVKTDLVMSARGLHIATLQVFTYNLDSENCLRDVNRLRLTTDAKSGHYWEPVLQTRRTDGVDGAEDTIVRCVNLHIFSTEDHNDKPFQANDFNQCVKLLGSQVTLKPEFAYQADRIDPNDKLPDGVAPQETEDLALRTRRMGRLGRLVCQNHGDANQAWYEDDALDDSSGACGDMIMEAGG
jgi:hypothetical protein